MNCKQGDLAIVVRAKNYPEHLGKIVKVLRFSEAWKAWEVDLVVIVGLPTYAGDKSLRPIRPSEGQDETLSWKDVPQGECA